MTTKFNTWYMDEALFNLSGVIETAQRRLKDVDFDTLVGTGFSGSIVIPSLALAMGKKFVLIRKETDDSHHGRGRLVGQMGEKWIFVDDFVSSGRTRRRVIEKIANMGGVIDREQPIMMGQYMYVNWSAFGPAFEPYEAHWTELNW